MIGVLVSGSGTNLQALIDAGLPIVCVGSNKPGVMGLERAKKAGIETGVFELESYPDRPARDTAMADWLQDKGIEWVVLAGYMHVLTAAFLSRYPRRVVNLHPALCPAFPGAHAITEALAYGVRWTGVTVHFVDEGVDTGPIILQEPVEVKDADTAETLAERIHAVEHRLLPAAVRLCLDGRVRFYESSRRVRIT
ncbi:MAG: phosphoribosylglycinamide formyltransferase [Gaiellaceae bacterium]